MTQRKIAGESVLFRINKGNLVEHEGQIWEVEDFVLTPNAMLDPKIICLVRLRHSQQRGRRKVCVSEHCTPVQGLSYEELYPSLFLMEGRKDGGELSEG